MIVAISSERKSWNACKDLTGADLQRSKIKHPGDVQESLSPEAIQLYSSLYYCYLIPHIPIVFVTGVIAIQVFIFEAMQLHTAFYNNGILFA